MVTYTDSNQDQIRIQIETKANPNQYQNKTNPSPKLCPFSIITQNQLRRELTWNILSDVI